MMSQVKRKVTPCAALALAAALGFGVLAVPARALEYVDLNKPATLTVSLSDGAYEAYRDDLAKDSTPIPVQVFKVAEINEGGTYKAMPGFENFAGELADPAQWKAAVDDNGNKVSETEYWQGVITRLVETLYAEEDYTVGEETAEEGGESTEPTATPVPSITVPGPGSNLGDVNIPTVNKDAQDPSVAPAYEIELTASENPAEDYRRSFDDLDKGLYLIVPLTTETQRYEYRFTPSLVSVPQLSNAVGGSALDPGISMGSSDEWQYDVNAYLKPSQKERLGQLLIKKELDRYNSTFEGATFVFRIEGKIDGETVFLDYRALKFQNRTPQEVLVEGIPVGAEVTVTEVYSGASYTVKGDNAHTVTIPAMDEQLAGQYEVDGKATALTVFQNDYDGHLRGGESAINEYKYLGELNGNGTWDVHRADEGGAEAATPDNGEGGGTQ